MLFEILSYLKNPDFYLTDRVKEGMFTIENGVIDLPFLMDGQYYIIEGSVFNDDQVHQHPAYNLQDESFYGRIVPLKIPKAILQKLPEIESYEAWRNKRISTGGDFTSESFNGYSYSVRVSQIGMLFTWQEYFEKFFSVWRCI